MPLKGCRARRWREHCPLDDMHRAWPARDRCRETSPAQTRVTMDPRRAPAYALWSVIPLPIAGGGLDIHRKQITFDYLVTATGQVGRSQISPADREHLRA